MYQNWIYILLAAFVLTACGPEAPQEPETGEAPETSETAATEPATEPAEESRLTVAERIDEALAGEHRSSKNASRDNWRHPKETLLFFGLEPDMTVVEIYPGGGWYTEVLAPVSRDEGHLVAAHFNPDGSDYRERSYNNYIDKLEEHPDVYDNVEVISIGGGEELSLGEPESADMVLTFRNMHSFTSAGEEENFFAAAHNVLKPNGILGVVQHRADEGADPMKSVKNGYLPEAFVIEKAEAAGFKLDDRAEINANPDDTHDHPEGVWTLPPSLRLGDEDREKYEAIGESDRMTLRFIKT
ncbi:MAG: methyltransferase [Pseudomonadales bacterium]